MKYLALARAFVKSYAMLLVIGVLLLIVILSRVQLGNARSDAKANAFRADSTVAANDTTRAVNEKAKKILGDSLRGVERRAYQAEIQRDALDVSLRRQTAAMTTIVASIRDLNATGTGKVTESPEGVRAAHFDIDSVPYHAKADVSLPAAPQSGSIALSVKLDPARIGARVQCGKAKGAGIRPATVMVTTPSWLTAQIDSPQFSPEVCNPEKSHWPWLVIGGAAGAGFTIATLLFR